MLILRIDGLPLSLSPPLLLAPGFGHFLGRARTLATLRDLRNYVFAWTGYTGESATVCTYVYTSGFSKSKAAFGYETQATAEMMLSETYLSIVAAG